MNRYQLATVTILSIACPILVVAQTDTTSAINAGKQFATTMLPQNLNNATPAAANPSAAVNTSTSTPLYTTNQPNAVNFRSGVNLTNQGSQAINDCKNYVSNGNPVDDQACAGVNFLTNNPTTKSFVIQNNDPALVSFKQASANAVNTDSPGQQCITQTINKPGSYVPDVCSQTSPVDSVPCTKTYTPSCKSVPVTITASASGEGALSASISPTSQPGVYSFTVAGGGTGTIGYATIAFQPSQYNTSFYVTLSMEPIDDAGVVAFNGIPIWAGYPNSGPQYSNFGATATYSASYAWTEPLGGTGPNTTFYADTKLLDSCPSGYSPQFMPTGQGSDTSQFQPGFFCNSNGKFLMNRHEGSNAAGASFGGSYPVQTGTNTIQVFWGTSAGGYGHISLAGTLYMLSTNCESSNVWQDSCAPMRLAQ